jgi:ADP-heptose:LPS heptosyltransferase
VTPPDKNLLVFRFGQIGDTIAALPSLWVLRRRFPNARIVILSEIPTSKTHQPPETVLPPAGLVDAFVKYPGGASVKNFFAAWRQIRQLRKHESETLVYLTPGGRTQKQRLRDRIFFRLCGIRRLLAFKGFAQDLQPRLPNGTLAVLPKEADALLERLKLDGIPVPAAGRGCMDLRITDAERERAAVWWRQKGCAQPPRRWLAVCPGAKETSKLWPWERYAETVQLLINHHGIFPVIVGGGEDRETGGKLLEAWRTGFNAAGELSVRESAALMESALFYLGNDTGAMHLASAVGRPCVALFSARDWPGRWHPYGDGHRVLRFDVPCSGCMLKVCDRDLECLNGIQVSEVYRACVEILARTGLDPDREKYAPSSRQSSDAR